MVPVQAKGVRVCVNWLNQCSVLFVRAHNFEI